MTMAEVAPMPGPYIYACGPGWMDCRQPNYCGGALCPMIIGGGPNLRHENWTRYRWRISRLITAHINVAVALPSFKPTCTRLRVELWVETKELLLSCRNVPLWRKVHSKYSHKKRATRCPDKAYHVFLLKAFPIRHPQEIRHCHSRCGPQSLFRNWRSPIP